MANENVARFEELLRTDKDLQAKLQDAVSAFDGDKADEGAVFAATVGKVAAEAGLPITLEESKAYVLAERELSDGELEAVAGGGGGCYIVGGGNEVGFYCKDVEGIGAMCAYVGVTTGAD